MKIVVLFDDMSVLECENVVDSRKFWRFVSKSCKYWQKRGRRVRVVKVIKGVNV